MIFVVPKFQMFHISITEALHTSSQSENNYFEIAIKIPLPSLELKQQL